MLTTFSAVAQNNSAAASKLERQSPTGQHTWMHLRLQRFPSFRRSNTYHKGAASKKEENYKENVGEDKTKTKTGRATVTICCGILTILPFNVAQAEARGDVDMEGRKMLAYVVNVFGDWADVAYT